jgi:cytochrome bd-type quinol oxidase subunit 2
VALAIPLIGPTAARTWRQSGPFAALGNIALAVVTYIVIAAIILAVETRLHGRTRQWARIAEVSTALAVVVFGFAWNGGNLMLAGLFWVAITGGLVAFMLLRRDVTT